MDRSRCHLAWIPQVTSALAKDFRLITFDNRGHGNSEKPAGLEPYQNSAFFAADLRAVIERSGPQKPIIVAWSIGGVLADDYLAHEGDGAVAGVVYLGAVHDLGPQGSHFGPAFAENGPE
ncbi:MAG: alpha/beta fold hydrolase [Myxococcota bacterium]